MASIWVESLGRSLQQALDQLASAVSDCGEDLWETSMWQVPAPGVDHPFLGEDWQPISDLERRDELAQRWVRRRATPWSVAWHALEVFDYDLNGEFAPWAPPPPFAGHPHWRDLTNLPGPWSRAEVLAYAAVCGERLGAAFAAMTDELGAKPLPPAHRYHGQPHASLITSLVGHTTEHAAQIRQFITAAGVAALA